MRLWYSLTLPTLATAIRFPITARSLVGYTAVNHGVLAKADHEVALEYVESHRIPSQHTPNLLAVRRMTFSTSPM
jgi:hypothetical protein